MVDIDVRDDRQSTAHADTSNVKSFQTGVLFHLNQILNNIILDGFPHVTVSFLNFTVGTGVFIDNLNLFFNLLEEGREYLAKH